MSEFDFFCYIQRLSSGMMDVRLTSSHSQLSLLSSASVILIIILLLVDLALFILFCVLISHWINQIVQWIFVSAIGRVFKSHTHASRYGFVVFSTSLLFFIFFRYQYKSRGRWNVKVIWCCYFYILFSSPRTLCVYMMLFISSFIFYIYGQICKVIVSLRLH